MGNLPFKSWERLRARKTLLSPGHKPVQKDSWITQNYRQLRITQISSLKTTNHSELFWVASEIQQMILLISLHSSSVIEPRFILLFYSPLQLQPDSSQTHFNSLPCFAYFQRQGVCSLSGQFVPVLYHLHWELFFLIFNYNFPCNLYPLPLRLQLRGKFDSVLSVITHCTTETATKSSHSLLSQATQSQLS